LFDELDPLVKFNPRFFLLSQQYNSNVYLTLRFSHAWSMPLGVFLFVAKPDSSRLRTLFVAAGNPQIQKLRAVLSRLQAQSSVDKPSLSAYFWRMNVLR
jgi:hypothetical protein